MGVQLLLTKTGCWIAWVTLAAKNWRSFTAFFQLRYDYIYIYKSHASWIMQQLFCWSFWRKMHRIPWPQVFVPLALFSLDTQRARKAQTKHRGLAFGQICWYPTTTFILKGFHTHRHFQWDSNYWSLFKCCRMTMWCYFLHISTVAGCMPIL